MNISVALAEDTPVDLSAVQNGLVGRLNTAHQHLEERFTAGAEALMSMMEVIGRLVGTLDRLTNALDGETASAAMDSIRRTTTALAVLPEKESNRGKTFRDIAAVCAQLEPEVAEMREIMRYLVSIAVTVKVTGADLPGFTVFADEIRNCTHDGSRKVESFITQLQQVQAEILRACDVSAEMVSRYQQVLPDLVRGLEDNNHKIDAEHAAMAQLAVEVRQLATGVQSKIASVLSNLQIGDITRQRIEHIRSAYEILDTFIEEHPDLSADDQLQLRRSVTRLCRLQLQETLDEFSKGSAQVMGGMTGLTTDAQRMLSTRDTILRNPQHSTNGTMRALKESVIAAHRLVTTVEKSGALAARIAASAATRTTGLLEGIGIVQEMERDVHFLALNSTLRCVKLGDAGRAVNVVSMELRNFAAALVDPAQRIVSRLKEVQDLSRNFGSGGTVQAEDDEPYSVTLQTAIDVIDRTCTSIDDSLKDFATEAENAFSTIGRSIGSLDFDTGLGDELRQCLALLEEVGDDDRGEVAVTAPAQLGELAHRIFAIYTMAQERAIHLALFPVQEEASEAPQEPAAQEEDDLDDFLF